ncbi:MAG: site-specific DNA-methyltransferase [Bacteroidota bacterium]
MFYNIDCIQGSKKYLKDNSIDLIITDPPYGIQGDQLHKHYNRDESKVIDGYVEIPKEQYAEFSLQWIKEAERVLKPGGSIYIVSGYTNLVHILNALQQTQLKELNHIIWKYNFGVYTKNKFISSHYHILLYVKPGKKHTFNTFAFYADFEKDENGNSLNYKDREDVWMINREYKPGEIKNKNELPKELLIKMILYSSNPDDTVCDFFLGSFSTAKVAIALGRNACGFEINKNAFDYQIKEIQKIKKGEWLDSIRNVPKNRFKNAGKTITTEEKNNIIKDYHQLLQAGYNKQESIEKIMEKYQRGYWSILKIIQNNSEQTLSLF